MRLLPGAGSGGASGVRYETRRALFYAPGRGGWRPDTLVCHIAEGTLGSVIEWFTRDKRSRASAHKIVSEDGRTVVTFVDDADIAFANGRVELDRDVASVVRLRKAKGVNPNRYTLSLEHAGFAREERSPAQLATSAAVLAEWCLKWGIPAHRTTILGHYEIDGARRAHCPGFDLGPHVERVRALVAAIVAQGTVPMRTLAVVRVDRVNLRAGPGTQFGVHDTATRNEVVALTGHFEAGEDISGSRRWYQTAGGLWAYGAAFDEED